MQFFFGSAGPESQYASQSASERMGSFGTELQQAVVSWCSLLFARSCIHDTMCVSALAEVLEARALKSSAQTTATHRERRRAPRMTGGGACRDSRGVGWWVSTESVRTEKPSRFHYLERGDLQEKSLRFNVYYCCIAVPVQTLVTAAVGKREMRYSDHST